MMGTERDTGPMYRLPKPGDLSYKQRSPHGKWVHILSPGDYDHVIYGTIKESKDGGRKGL